MTVADPQAIVGVSKYWRHYGFQTYAHTTKYEPLLPSTLPSLWTAASVAAEPTGARAIAVSVTCAFSGIVSVAYGLHSQMYGMNAPPKAVQAGVPAVIRLTDLQAGQAYYICPRFSGVIPNPSVGGLPFSGSWQYGELATSAR